MAEGSFIDSFFHCLFWSLFRFFLYLIWVLFDKARVKATPVMHYGGRPIGLCCVRRSLFLVEF